MKVREDRLGQKEGNKALQSHCDTLIETVNEIKKNCDNVFFVGGTVESENGTGAKTFSAGSNISGREIIKVLIKAGCDTPAVASALLVAGKFFDQNKKYLDKDDEEDETKELAMKLIKKIIGKSGGLEDLFNGASIGALKVTKNGIEVVNSDDSELQDILKHVTSGKQYSKVGKKEKKIMGTAVAKEEVAPAKKKVSLKKLLKRD